MIEFQKVTFEDQAVIAPYARMNDSRSCEVTFANIYLWAREYPMAYAIVEECLVYRTMEETPKYCFPIGSTAEAKQRALSALLAYCREEGKPFLMGGVTPEQFALLDEWYPERFDISYDRDYADYVYETESLQTLAGKKLHGKRNHVNRFLKTHTDWQYEPINDSNREEVFQMAQQWRTENGCNDDEEKNVEMCVALNALRLLDDLHLTGGLLRVDGQVAAFAIGEPVCADTFVVHIEKALTEVEGAYPMINQQFALHAAKDYQYINREDDMGEEGLRQAKMTYRPVFLVEKGTVTERRIEKSC